MAASRAMPAVAELLVNSGDKRFYIYDMLMISVSERFQTRLVLVLGHRHVHPVKPMLHGHQETRLSKPRRQQKLHATISQGSQFTVTRLKRSLTKTFIYNRGYT